MEIGYVDFLLPWKLVKASMEIQGSFHCRWNRQLPLLPRIAASTDTFCGSFHELPCTPTYFHLPSREKKNFLLLPQDFHEGPSTFVRPTSVEASKVMFCRVCRFRVRVWESCRTSRSFGYGYASVRELTQVPGIVARACISRDL